MQALGKEIQQPNLQIMNDVSVSIMLICSLLILGETPPREIICIYLRRFSSSNLI